MANKYLDTPSSNTAVAEPDHTGDVPTAGHKAPAAKKGGTRRSSRSSEKEAASAKSAGRTSGDVEKELEALKVEEFRYHRTVDNVTTAVMMVDRDFIVTYVNEATRQLLTKNAAEFRKVWPNFDNQHIVGSCIDIFHKNPSYQRRLLSDPKNVPHHADISVGPLKFSLSVNGTFDLEGNYTGNVLEWANVTELRVAQGQVAAVNVSMVTSQYELDGTVVTANENFLKIMGYRLDEIIGRPQTLFVSEHDRNSSEYRDLWARLNRGESQTVECKRIAKSGKEIWFQASYTAILDEGGRPMKVVEFATDITAQKLQNANYEGQIAAIGRTQSVVEFRLDGTVLTANDNFLKILGYTLAEVKDKPHAMFLGERYRHSNEYRDFWADLNRGEPQVGEFQRITRSGAEIWIQATYNPILDLNGKPFKHTFHDSSFYPFTQSSSHGGDRYAFIDKNAHLFFSEK